MATSLRTDRVRVIVAFKRAESVSKADFDEFWLNEYPTLFKSLEIAKGKVLRIEQSHANQAANEGIASVGLPVAPFDAQVTIEGTSFEDIMAVFISQEYRTIVGAPSVKFFDRGGQFFAANFATIIEN